MEHEVRSYPVSPLLGPVYGNVDARIHRLKIANGVSPPEVLSYLWRNIGSIQFTDFRNCSHDAFWTKMGLGNFESIRKQLTDSLPLF